LISKYAKLKKKKKKILTFFFILYFVLKHKHISPSIFRDKEEKQDYRYMPEPNLLPLSLLQLKLDPSDFRERIPVLPEQERTMLMEKYQLSLETAIQLVVIYLVVIYYDFVCNVKS
jgi:Asp-tRNA(Asn)/Glu-tRNA(Gln) amidotransferase B subunit